MDLILIHIGLIKPYFMEVQIEFSQKWLVTQKTDV